MSRIPTTDAGNGAEDDRLDGADVVAAAAPGHVAAVRRLFVDRLTGEQLDAIGDAAEAVLAGFAESPGDADAVRVRA